jgi:AcrR family transcriptional regulator
MERGRPRSFDADTALDRALAVFWRNGYQGASMAELTEAMGINKPSLYAAFGDKAALYMRALDRYVEQQGGHQLRAMQAETQPERAIRAFMISAVDMQTEPKLPGGCMVVNGSTGCGSLGVPDDVVAALNRATESSLSALRTRLHADQRAGLLSKDTNPDALADFFMAVLSGMAVMSKRGVTRRRLLVSVEQALRVFEPPLTVTSKTRTKKAKPGAVLPI